MTCNHCRGSLSLPEGYTSATIRCHWCDAAAEVPENLRSTKIADVIAQLDEPSVFSEQYTLRDPETLPPKPETGKPKVLAGRGYRAEFATTENAGAPLLKGSKIETDHGPVVPYTVPGTGLKPCPECRGELPLAATFCVHCGTPLIGPDREPVRRQYTPIDREWNDGWRPHFRRNLFFLLLVLNALLVLMSVVVNGADITKGSTWLENLAYSIGPLFIQASLLGTYGTLRVYRERGGHSEVWRTWHFAFIPMRSKLVRLDGCAGAGHVPQVNGFAEFIVCLMMFSLCLLPGFVFLFMVIVPTRCNTVIVDENRGWMATLLRGKSLDDAQECAKVVAEATGMIWHKAL